MEAFFGFYSLWFISKLETVMRLYLFFERRESDELDCSKIGSVFHHAICIDCDQCLAVTRRATRVRAIKLLEWDSTTIQSVGETR